MGPMTVVCRDGYPVALRNGDEVLEAMRDRLPEVWITRGFRSNPERFRDDAHGVRS